jgi:flagellar basal body-associated protein FliL
MKSHEMNNYLIIYLSNLSLEEVRGEKNINRVLREVQDSLNDRLWPGGKPLISKVSLKEWIVQ